MSSLKFFFTYSREFLRHWGSYILLIIGTNIVLEMLVIPSVQFSIAFILRQGKIPYVSNTNILTIITKHPGVLAALLLLLALVLTLVFLQFTFQLFSIKSIQTKEERSLWELFKQSLYQMRHLRPATFFFFLFYFVLILPFANAIFRTPLLSKVTIPVFILDYLSENILFLLLLMVASVAVSYIGIRLLFVLPLMIFSDEPPKQAMARSLELTHHRYWHYAWRIFILTVFLTIVSYVGYGVSYGLQVVLDFLPKPFPAIGAMLTLTSIQLFSQLMLAWATVLYFSMLVQKFYPLVISSEHPLRLIRPSLWTRIAAGILVIFLGGTTLLSNVLYLAGVEDSIPLTISHRGVDNGNGVQNTIPAMAATIKEKPDYIEMDVQETKDHQFVVFHDKNFRKLTGKNAATHELTLSESQELQAVENGHVAPIASFDDYLAFADKHQQKLLIEIKTNATDSKEMMDRFIEKYQDDILTHHHRIHSLDYKIVEELKRKAPKLYVSYVLPYNLVFPQTPANAYTMEETTLTGDFVRRAHLEKKEVYAWTVNDADSMDRMVSLNVNGIVTDDLKTLQEQIKTYQESPSYAKRIEMYINRLPALDERISEN
ncbi:glycerophosphoryl diester phosphodiesterase membrane domain-containing protein [Candidatus Enterococcus murrayae]|uniref:Glycerophosphodiester phosphodiesterase n=1 Tax=Candidatus Enterococcus murrayae TaxID=2815321 RepID=A0ABS3HDS8_9ENTE|nr:glycerophosphodiester phosphodiesterase [Enterococcus sp. MJM16]MBO0451610.1 glycerophosphodiester phosphodiesterase [Enterococcus sp. MJM16]